MIRPLLKYPGGKHDLAPRISTAFGGPCRGRFYELFAGSGAVTLHRRQAGEVGAAWLSDLDGHLVNLHLQVSTRPDRVCEELEPYRTVVWSEPRYRRHLEMVNGADALGPAAAARLVVFNKTCFSGLYRKNRQGAFNVGWNKEPTPYLPTADHVLQVGAALSGALVLQRPALEAIADAGPHRDPRLDRRAPHTFRPTRPAPACSCGEPHPHEVARRTTIDDARLVILSTGEMRLFLRHGIAPTMTVHVDRFAAPARHLLGWASVMTADQVERAMVAAHES